MIAAQTITSETILQVLQTVMDPEVPVLSIADLGIIRDIRFTQSDGTNGYWEILITPTYAGCPAMDMIATSMRMALYASGITDFKIQTVLSPAWTTNWMSAEGKEKLRQYGIAPPLELKPGYSKALFAEGEAISCPRCGSRHTRLISQFGSTACKALYACDDCMEPFDYFKCH